MPSKVRPEAIRGGLLPTIGPHRAPRRHVEDPRHESLRDEFGSADLSSALFDHPEGMRLVDCVWPSDPRVSDRVAACLDRARPDDTAVGGVRALPTASAA